MASKGSTAFAELTGQQSMFFYFFLCVFAKSSEIWLRSVVNKASKYFHVLIYDIKHTSYNLLVFF